MTAPSAPPPQPPAPSSAAAELGPLLNRVGRELSQAAQGCAEVQWLIAALLDRAHHPDLPAEMHMLQDIDRLQQTLADLAALLDAVAPLAGPAPVPEGKIVDALQLESLRSRLSGLPQPAHDGTAPAEETGVTWL